VTAPETLQEEGYAPPIAATAPAEGFAAPPVRTAGDSGRPAAPGLAKPRRRSVWPWIALIALIVVVAVSAGLAVLWREKPQDLAIKEATEAPAKPAANSQSKIVERVPGAGPATPAAHDAPAASPVPANNAANPAPSAPATPAPQTPAVNPGAETPIPTVTVPTVPVRPNETAQASSQTGAAQPAAAPAIARAALLVETPSEPQKPKVVVGTATWSLVPASSGQAQTAGPTVHVDIDIPDAKMRATVTIRKNTDSTLPATHTIDLRFNFADGADIKGFKDMALPQMRRDDTPTGDALSGVRVKINDAYFLVGLTRSDADTTHNLELLATRNWLDFPLLFNDDHIAKLTFEKGATGQSVLAQAIEAWK
jgi:hypothetical protein